MTTEATETAPATAQPRRRRQAPAAAATAAPAAGSRRAANAAKKGPTKAAQGSGPIAKQAAKDAETVARKAAAEAKARAEEAAKAAAVSKLTSELEPIAKEVNVRVEKAEKMEHDADDHRLAAILQLEKARIAIEKAGKGSGINFKEWCAKNVKWSPETIRKMLPIAQAKNPAKALEDMRVGNKKRNKAHRAKKVGATATAGHVDTSKPQTVAAVVQQAKPEVQLAAVQKVAADLGMAVVSQTDAKRLAAKGDAAAFATVEDFQKAFASLKAADQMKVANFCATAVGAKLVMPENIGGTVSDPGEIPAQFKK